MSTHQMYGQTGSSSEPQIDQNMHNRNYYSTRYLLLFFYTLLFRYNVYKNVNVSNENIYLKTSN